MEFKNPKDLKPKKARELALELQVRMIDLENTLDDLMRAVEIAQYTKQYNVTEVFVRQAEDLLKARHVAALLALTCLYGAAGIFLYRRLAGLLRDWQTLSASLDQLRKDRACLEKILA